MKEDFLHYVWQFKKFRFTDLQTVQGDKVTIVHSGQYTQLAGPDFFNAQLILNDQKWAGNIEIHVKSSDWYLHQHETDAAYDNVVLHVVWQHDAPIFRKDNSEIPVLELSKYVDSNDVANYRDLMTPKSWIFCEKQLATCDDFILKNWLERLFFERLERKSVFIEGLLNVTENDWEGVLFCMLAKNFGLNTNGESFYKIAQSITFSIIRKESLEVKYLEALFFGQASIFPNSLEDNYSIELKAWYDYIALKYNLEQPLITPVSFFKHRPDNFPTIRLAQLAMVYHLHRNLFSKIMEAKNQEDIYSIFNCSVSEYWKSHYNFDKSSAFKEKALSKSFIDLIIINTIIPIQFAYAKEMGKDNSDQLILLMSKCNPEKNSTIEKFTTFGLKATNAFETQALLQLKNEYCINKRCLQCGLGLSFLKQ
jgi:hypothetical protein